MTRCDGCDKWLDGQDEYFDLDEGVLCPECATEWYPDLEWEIPVDVLLAMNCMYKEEKLI